MEGQPAPAAATVASAARAEVDTSRPFRSVREAVAVFGERILVGDRDAYAQKATGAVGTVKPACSAPQKPIYSAPGAAKPMYSACSSPPSFSSSSSHFNQDREEELMIVGSLRRLEAELEETKKELRLLKKRESETEVALASLNAELHKNMSKLAEMEAAGAGKAKAAAGKSVSNIEGQLSTMASERWGVDEGASFEYLPSLSAALRLGEMDDKFGGRKKAKTLKKKPIVPLIGDIFFGKKKASADFDNSLYSYSMH